MYGIKACENAVFLMRKGTKKALKPSLESEPLIYYDLGNFLPLLQVVGKECSYYPIIIKEFP